MVFCVQCLRFDLFKNIHTYVHEFCLFYSNFIVSSVKDCPGKSEAQRYGDTITSTKQPFGQLFQTAKCCCPIFIYFAFLVLCLLSTRVEGHGTFAPVLSSLLTPKSNWILGLPEIFDNSLYTTVYGNDKHWHPSDNNGSKGQMHPWRNSVEFGGIIQRTSIFCEVCL